MTKRRVGYPRLLPHTARTKPTKKRGCVCTDGEGERGGEGGWVGVLTVVEYTGERERERDVEVMRC